MSAESAAAASAVGASPAPAAAATPFRGPLKVKYCAACTMPPEYCEFGPCWDRCKVLLEKNHPDLLAAALERMKVTAPAAAEEAKDGDAGAGAAAASSSAPAEEKKKKEKKGDVDEDDDEDGDEDDDEDDEDDDDDGKSKVKFAAAASADGDDEFLAAAAPVVKVKKAPAGPGIYLSMANRSKKKFITTVKGFESFNIVLKDVSKLMSKKFACAASVVKGTDGNEIAIQGDLLQDLPHWIIEEFPQIDKKLVWTVDKAGKKCKAF